MESETAAQRGNQIWSQIQQHRDISTEVELETAVQRWNQRWSERWSERRSETPRWNQRQRRENTSDTALAG